MTFDVLKSIDTEKFKDRLLDRFDVNMTLVLADRHGRILEHSGDATGLPIPGLADVLRRSAGMEDDGPLQFIPDDRSLLLLNEIELGGISVFVVMLNRFQSATELTYCSVITHAIEIAFDAIIDSLLLNHELNDMADDLSARYEELNLFYGLDDIVETQDAAKGKVALQKLANNCSQYLNTDVVSIVVGNADIDVESHSVCSRDFLTAWQASRQGLSKVLLSRISGQFKSVVINDANEVFALTNGKLRAKLAVMPIHSGRGKTLGYLFMARMIDGQDFSNSDRRLLRVVAEQASTIVSVSYDVLTGLLNREGLLPSIEKAISQSSDAQSQKSLLILDLNQFRMINDSCGRSAGDELIRRVANHLRIHSNAGNQAARLEGDTFALLVTDKEKTDAWSIASEITRNLSEVGFRWDNRFFDISAGVGIVRLNNTIVDANDAFALGTISCDIAKQRGPGEIFLYNATSAAIESARGAIDWIPHIRTALENDSFELYGQQIVPFQEEQSNSVHFEILLRLRDKDGNAGSPFQMIKAAEDYKMVSRIDEWVIGHTLLALKECQSRYPDINVRCSVNMSGQSVTEDFFLWLRKVLMESPQLIPCIQIEITETNVVSNLTSAIRLIESLRSIGVKFSLDDFGTGMSSFGYLRDLPVDYLKIDGAFVKHVVEDPISHAMVESIHRVGHLMGLKTVAEFVENDLIAEKLRKIGIDYGQGYGLNKPAPLFEQLDQFAEEYRALIKEPASANQGS